MAVSIVLAGCFGLSLGFNIWQYAQNQGLLKALRKREALGKSGD